MADELNPKPTPGKATADKKAEVTDKKPEPTSSDKPQKVFVVNDEASEQSFKALIDRMDEENALQNASNAEQTNIKNLQSALADKALELDAEASNSMQAMIEELQGNKGADLEKTKEANARAEDMLRILEKISDNTEASSEEVKLSGPGQWIAGLLVAIGAMFVGLAVGIVAGIGDSLKLWAKLIKGGFSKLFPKTSKAFGNIIKSIGDFFGKIVARFKNLKVVKAFGRITKSIGDFFGKFTNAFKVLKNFKFPKFTFITKPIDGISKSWKWLTAGIKTVSAPFKTIMGLFKGVQGAKGAGGMLGKMGPAIKGFLNPLKSLASTVFKVFAPIGRIFGRLFFPLQIIMGVIDGVKGFIDGYKNTEGSMFEKIIGGLIGGIQGILNGLIAMPLDMLKKAVSWVMGKLGFDTTGIDSFSFSDLLGGIFDSIKDAVFAIIDWFKLLFSNPGEAVGNLFTGYKNMITDLYKWIVRMILPDPKGGAWYNPLSLIQHAIPDSVYEWAGVNAETGERIPEPEELVTAAPSSGDELLELSVDNKDLERDQIDGESLGKPIITQVDGSTSTSSRQVITINQTSGGGETIRRSTYYPGE